MNYSAMSMTFVSFSQVRSKGNVSEIGVSVRFDHLDSFSSIDLSRFHDILSGLCLRTFAQRISRFGAGTFVYLFAD
jgi:hypothetical protein